MRHFILKITASGTSSKSTKLAHGGIRYLPQFDFPMIHEGVVERGLMVRHAPPALADAYCASRLDRLGSGALGTLPHAAAGIPVFAHPQSAIVTDILILEEAAEFQIGPGEIYRDADVDG